LTEPPVLRCDSGFDDPDDWRFFSFRPLPGYRAAGAVRCHAAITWRTVAKQSIESLLPSGL
jgi:hypothetical protein